MCTGRISGAVCEKVCIVCAKKAYTTEAPPVSAPHSYAFKVYVKVIGI